MSGFIPVKGSASSGGGFIPAPKGVSHPHGAGGLIDNLAHDVKDAVVGLPLGLEQTFVHPIRAARAFETTTWHTWSPLFHGHVGEFAHGVYDHPLAPLLDVLSVFSLGAGSAAKLGELATGSARAAEIAGGAEAGTFGEKLAALRQPKAIERTDPTAAGRVVQPKQLSTRAGRRLMQEGTHKAFLAAGDHLPKWFTQPVKEANFQRAFVSDTAHRHLAAMGQYAFAMAAGKQMAENTPEAIAARANVLAHTHQTMIQHAPHRAPSADKIPTGYVSIISPEHIDRLGARELRKAQRQAKYWDGQRAKHAADAHSVESITNQIADANDRLAKMNREGTVQRGIPKGMPGADKTQPTTKQLINAQAAERDAIQKDITRLSKQLDKAHVARGNHNKALAELDQLGQSIHAHQERMWGQHFTNHAADYHAFQSYLGNFARMATRGGTTKRALKLIEETGARDANGQLIIVPRHTAEALGREGQASSAFVRLLWHNPTRVWKTMQVGYSPRTIVNNGVGNWMLFMLRSDPVSGVLGMRDAIRWAKGEKEAVDFETASVGVNSHWLSEFKDELGQGGVGGPNVAPAEGGGFTLREGKKERLKQGVYPLVHKWSDEPVRASALASYMHKDAGVRALAKEFRSKGLEREQAFNRAVRTRLLKDPHLHDRAVAFSRSISGDYVALNKLERHVKNIMPFYLWNRHIVHSGVNLTLDTPGRVAMLQSISNQGVEKAEEVLGPLPDFLKGAVPLSIFGLGGKGGRSGIISTQGLNPFATLGDLAESGQALATGGGLHPGESTLGQLFPAIPAAVEWATKKSLLTGQDIKSTGPPLAFIAQRIEEQIPAIKVSGSLLHPASDVTPKGNPTLYAKSSTESLSSLLGIPIKEIDQSAAAAVAAKQDPNKKKKRHGFVNG